MIDEYVPRVLVVGNAEKFRARIQKAGRAARIVGIAFLRGEFTDETTFDLLENQQLLLNNQFVELDVLRNFMEQESPDYVIFMDYSDCLKYSSFLSNRERLVSGEQIITIDTFIHNVGNGFQSYSNEMYLYRLLNSYEFGSLLDADGYFAEGAVYTKQTATRIEGICPTGSETIFSNIYDRQYSVATECSLRHYDAILLSAERDFVALQLKFLEFANMTDSFVVFIRASSSINRLISERKVPSYIVSIRYHEAVNGGWFVFRKEPPTDLGMYVVTHKKLELPPLPEGYIPIHAGHAISEDLGYPGDDIGDSISELNRYLNEMTAVYWVWKNTTHDFVGISHYRRFFSEHDRGGLEKFDPVNIIPSERALELLGDCDIIVPSENNYLFDQRAFLVNDLGTPITNISVQLIRSQMALYQPSYLDVFDRVMGSCSLYRCNMMITRRFVFDAYCEWLFSFAIKSHEEIMKILDPDEMSVSQKRILAYMSERLLNMWLMKNNLRIKELPIIENL